MDLPKIIVVVAGIVALVGLLLGMTVLNDALKDDPLSEDERNIGGWAIQGYCEGYDYVCANSEGYAYCSEVPC